MGATSSSVPSSDLSRTLQSYARLALAGLLAWLALVAFRDADGYVPLLSDIDLAIHEFGHMLFMPFGIQFLGSTMMILGGSLTQVALPLLFFGYFLRTLGDGKRRDLLRRLPRRPAHAPRRTDRPGERRARLEQPAHSLGIARARHGDCAVHAGDRVAGVRLRASSSHSGASYTASEIWTSKSLRARYLSRETGSATFVVRLAYSVVHNRGLRRHHESRRISRLRYAGRSQAG